MFGSVGVQLIAVVMFGPLGVQLIAVVMFGPVAVQFIAVVIFGLVGINQSVHSAGYVWSCRRTRVSS